jgi:hypothetical protein
MSELTTEDIRQLDWGDATLSGFCWEKEGPHLRLFLEHASRPIQSILCHWVSNVTVPSTWQHAMLSWSGSIEPLADGRWRVSIDLASNGDLSLECDKVTATLREAG